MVNNPLFLDCYKSYFFLLVKKIDNIFFPNAFLGIKKLENYSMNVLCLSMFVMLVVMYI